ncbi:MAG: tRNA lysidine(34) synthetase TilS [Cryomorphaceae bacterium]
MRQKLAEFIRTHRILTPEDQILVAVSGGRDSVALAHALIGLGYSVSIAHMNYRLRGAYSDDDSAFVQSFANQLGVACHQSLAWDEAPSGNIQEAARKARYAFFDQLCSSLGYNKIATAHHFDDRVESLFINLLRGTGMHGLGGIPIQRGNIVRPLLWADRPMIDAYLVENKLEWREDASNEGDAYLRNRIRHHLMPLLLDLDPDALKKLGGSMDRLGEDSSAVEAMARLALEKKGAHMRVQSDRFPEKHKATWMYHCLRPFGFNRTQCSDLCNASEPGKRVESELYAAIKSKDGIDLINKDTHGGAPFIITQPGTYVQKAYTITLMAIDAVNQVHSVDNTEVNLDRTSLSFPMTLRTIEKDDRFHPLGMAYEVNLRDYLRDKGAGPAETAQTFVLTDVHGRIAWVPEVQIADWCKIEANTTSILSLSFRRNGD